MQALGLPKFLFATFGPVEITFHDVPMFGHAIEVHKKCDFIVSFFETIADAADGWNGDEPFDPCRTDLELAWRRTRRGVVRGLHHAGLVVSDLDRALDFYGRHLGAELDFRIDGLTDRTSPSSTDYPRSTSTPPSSRSRAAHVWSFCSTVFRRVGTSRGRPTTSEQATLRLR